MQIIGLTGLIKIELPQQNILLCDGGWIEYDGDIYRAFDPLFGVISSIEPMEEGVGDEVPALDMQFSPPSTAAIPDLSQPGYQQARIRFWIAEYSVATGQVVGEPDISFDGQVDQTSLRVANDERTLSVTAVSTAERLFERNIGNSLSPAFHKSVWPGEKGHDNATGLKIPGAWGVEGQGSSGLSSGSSGRGYSPIDLQEY